MTSGYLNTENGTKLYYRVSGSGQPLVCIHGFGADSSAYRLTERILSRRFMIVTMDLRGHGRTVSDGTNLGFESMARDLETFLEQIGLSDITLLGWSMGGMVAMEYIRLFGEGRLARLVLVETSLKVVNEGDWTYGLCKGKYTIDMAKSDLMNIRNDFMGFSSRFMKSMAPHMDKENQEILIRSMQGNKPEFMYEVWKNIVNSDLRDTLKGVESPCLVINGEESTFYSAESGRYIAESLRKGKHITIKGGHLAPIESPVEFNRAIESFITKQNE